MNIRRAILTGLAAALVAVPSARAQPAARIHKGSLSLGGLYTGSYLGYGYRFAQPLYGEIMSISDDLGNQGLAGLIVGGGYLLSPQLEAFLSVSFAWTSRDPGEVTVAVPSEYYYEQIAAGSLRQSRTVSEYDLLLGLKFHVSPAAGLDPYFGFGAGWMSASVPMMSGVSYTDEYDPVTLSHEVTVAAVELRTVRLHAPGGLALIGLEIALRPRLRLFAEGQFKFSSKGVVHPYGAAIGEPKDLRMNMSGLVLSAGLKLYL